MGDDDLAEQLPAEVCERLELVYARHVRGTPRDLRRPPLERRLEFARYLVERARLSDWPVSPTGEC